MTQKIKQLVINIINGGGAATPKLAYKIRTKVLEYESMMTRGRLRYLADGSPSLMHRRIRAEIEHIAQECGCSAIFSDIANDPSIQLALPDGTFFDVSKLFND